MDERVLVVVDMQNDFIDGSLGTPEVHQKALDVMKSLQIEVR